MQQGFGRQLLTTLALCSLLAGMAWGQEGKEKKAKKERPPMTKESGTVKSVDTTAKTLTVTLENGEEKTYTLSDRVMITLRGPILDGIQPNDQVSLMIREQDGAQVAVKVMVSREGVSPTAGKGNKSKKPKGEKKKGGKRKGKKGEAPPPPEGALP